MGIGLGANLVSYLQTKILNFSKSILISPVNSFRSEYSVSTATGYFNKPTYIMFGQVDKENSIDSRYQIFQKGKRNSHAYFSCYPCTGFYCYYERMTSIELEKLYRKNNIDVLLGSDRNNQPLFLPKEPKLNDLFFFDPISEYICNHTNYWTPFYQNTTCFRFMCIDDSDDETDNPKWYIADIIATTK